MEAVKYDEERTDEEEIPSSSVIARLKSQYPDRVLHRVEAEVAGEKHVFVMSGPAKPEWQRYRQEMTKATGDSDAQEKAIERAVVEQIRWPERKEVRDVFDANPALSTELVTHLHKFAGIDAEVRVKKL